MPFNFDVSIEAAGASSGVRVRVSVGERRAGTSSGHVTGLDIVFCTCVRLYPVMLRQIRRAWLTSAPRAVVASPEPDRLRGTNVTVFRRSG